MQATAKRYVDEMGSLVGVFKAYVAAWPSADVIKAQPAEFVRQTKDVFAALGNRISRENTELYALADRAA